MIRGSAVLSIAGELEFNVNRTTSSLAQLNTKVRHDASWASR
jgi:hypothetical protein